MFDPSNPLMPYLILFDIAVLTCHIFVVYWVYRDANFRYNRGAPWALLAAIFPVGGWLFYLLYRNSPLVQFDRIEAEYFDDEFEWTDYDEYRKNQSARVFQDLTSFWRKAEGSGYSPWIRASRERELRGKLSPEQLKALRAEKAAKRRKRIEQRRQVAAQKRELRAQRQQESKERQTMRGAHGFTFRLSDRRQKKLRRKLELLDKLKELPREDKRIEDLIYEMDYHSALSAAREGLVVAQEMEDKQGVVTYEHYIEKLSELISRMEQDSV